MKGATKCAARLKQLLRSLRTKLGKAPSPQTSDPITQMILGIFSRDVPESKARESLNRLRDMVVDYNELRVIPSIEVTELVGDLPQARIKCEDLSRALNKLFSLEHEVSLERLRELSRRDAQEYLANIDGLDAYSRARMMLLGLQKHAMPLDEAMWAYARKQGIIDEKCSLEEAQSFLERRIPEEEALETVALLEMQAWAEMGAVVRKGEAECIASVPPDRTTRNMLQMVASGQSFSTNEEEPPDELKEIGALDEDHVESELLVENEKPEKTPTAPVNAKARSRAKKAKTTAPKTKAAEKPASKSRTVAAAATDTAAKPKTKAASNKKNKTDKPKRKTVGKATSPKTAARASSKSAKRTPKSA